MPDIPQAAIGAAVEAAIRYSAEHPGTQWNEQSMLIAALEAAAPHIRAQAATRITELRKLAAAMLGTFHRTSDGYRARVGQVQIGRWRIALDWENDPDA